ncbi:MAG: hypothetical protein K1X47_05710 [Cyclobacteriaceae bacterium]|nr:hypothetical protein [Cyclobacteriaceae bacterium]
MNQVFRVATGWRILISVLAPPFILLGGALLFVLIGESYELSVLLISGAAGLAITGFMLYALTDAYRWRIEISDKEIVRRNVWGTRSIPREKIRGYRINGQYVFIEPFDNGLKRINISTYTARRKELIDWLVQNYPDLDQQEATAEAARIIEDASFGITTEARKARLAEAGKAARIVNGIGGVVALWMLFYPQPYDVVTVAAMCVPFAALAAIYLYRGLIHIDTRKNSAFPSVGWGLLACCVGVCARSILDFDVLDYGAGWTWMATAALLLCALAVTGTGELLQNGRRGFMLGLVVLIFSFGWAYGSYIIINCHFDQSEGDAYTTRVADKRVTSGRNTSYYVSVEPWGPVTETQEISVTEEEFQLATPGDTAYVVLRPGTLNASWYFLYLQPKPVEATP